MDKVLPAALVLVGLIHLLPLSGLFSPQKLTTLYGVTTGDRTLLLLLQHRALIFGLLGAFLLTAAWQPAWRLPAAIAGLASMLGYLALCLKWQPEGGALWRVFWIDLGASGVLLVGLALSWPG